MEAVVIHVRALAGQVADHRAVRGPAHIPHHRRGPGHQDHEHSRPHRMAAQILLRDQVLAFPRRAVEHRDGVVRGPGPDPPREPPRQAHQVSVVQHRIRLRVTTPDQLPPPGPEPARRVPHRVVGIEHDPVYAVIRAGQQARIAGREVISHPPTVGPRGSSRQPDCPEGAIPSGRSPGRNVVDLRKQPGGAELAAPDAGSLGSTPEGMAVRLAPRLVTLAGREELLAELDVRLTGRGEAEPNMVVLCGLGGAGKTSVAVEYAHRNLARSAVVWQFAAEEPAALAAGFSELATQLSVRDAPAIGEPVARVHAALARRADWLLVFDNVSGPSVLRGLLPPAGGGQVVITSQYPHWPGGRASEVPVLDRTTAAEFLIARTGAASTEEAVAAGELADELGGLPLALEQAAAYMQAVGRSIPEYLRLFRQRRAELLGRGEPAGYDKRVTTTWALAFAELEQADPPACCVWQHAVPLRISLCIYCCSLDPDWMQRLTPRWRGFSCRC